MRTRITVALAFLLVVAVLASAQDYGRELKITQPRMNGKDVTALQNRLLFLGFASVGEADGWFGPKTEWGVRSYRVLVGFSDEGVVDEAVWYTLFADQGALGRLNLDLKTISSLGLERAARIKRELVGYSSEGGSVEELRIDGTLKCAEIWLYGEMGKVHYRVFPVEDRYYVMAIEDAYPEPFDSEHATTTATIYYYSTDTTCEVRRGDLVPVRYDSVGVLAILGSR